MSKDEEKKSQNEDQTLWEHATKDVEPLHKQSQYNIDPPKKQHIKPKHNIGHRQTKSTHSPCVKHRDSLTSNEIDRHTARKLKRGQIKIDARLDLHGMTRSEAYIQMKFFIQNAYREHLKCILIITGKGGCKQSDTPVYQKGQGILKTNVPLWLEEPDFKKYVLQSEWAKPKDGGEGALYVLLRRNK